MTAPTATDTRLDAALAAIRLARADVRAVYGVLETFEADLAALVARDADEAAGTHARSLARRLERAGHAPHTTMLSNHQIAVNVAHVVEALRGLRAGGTQ